MGKAANDQPVTSYCGFHAGFFLSPYVRFKLDPPAQGEAVETGLRAGANPSHLWLK